MKKAVYFLFLIYFAAFSQGEEAFELGNTFYKEAKYEEAVSQWESVLKAGNQSAAVYFNLGNAHYKLNEIAPSIYYYEKALRLAPNDADIKTNLVLAQNQTIDAIEPLPQSIFSKWYNSTVGMFTFEGWAVVSVILIVLFTVSFLLYYYSQQSVRKRIMFTVSALLFIAITASTSFSFLSFSDAEKDRSAIIFAESVQVKNEPALRSNTIFTIHEGTKVQIIDEDDDWYRIELADGKDGWMLKSDLKEL